MRSQPLKQMKLGISLPSLLISMLLIQSGHTRLNTRLINGDIERYKARLVARGFTHREGEDFNEIFAPVAKLMTSRTLLSIAAARDWDIYQLDVNNAFLYRDLKEDIYMRIPQGFATAGKTRVCKL